MIGNYRGKRLFAGLLFAGRLFGPTDTAAPPSGGGFRQRPRIPEIFNEDDEILLLIVAAVAAMEP